MSAHDHNNPVAIGPRPVRPDLAFILIGTAVMLAYQHCLNNGFHLDDVYGLLQNPWIRSLRYIPRYFVDPFTLTSHKPNGDYRPILQITYALNYFISGYAPWSWHILNLLLHVCVSFQVFRLGQLLWGSRRILESRWIDPAMGDRVSLCAALLFAVHPITSGCVNYFWARSSLLVAAFVLSATTSYLRSMARPTSVRTLWLPVLLYALALFTKAEAISFFGVLVAADLVLMSAIPDADLRYATRFLRLAPFAVLSVAYLLLRNAVIPQFLVDARHALDMTSYAYFLTQLRAWGYYVGKLFWPVGFVADDTAFAISRTLAEPLVILAGIGWMCILGVLTAGRRRAPALVFLGACFFIHLAPHSSVFPLAEMVNEHRPYLPTLGQFLIISAAICRLAQSARISDKGSFIATGLLCIALIFTTRARTAIWRDDLSLWQDTVAKSPDSPRAQMNYGLALMNSGNFDEAENRFRETIRLAPQYYFAHINLGVVLEKRNDFAGASQSFDQAVVLGPNESLPYFFRGSFRSRRAQYDDAARDLRRAADLAAQPIDALMELSKCLEKAGRPDEARAARDRALSLLPK